MKRSKLYQLREIIEKASVNLSDEDALSAVELFPSWEVGKSYSQNDRVLFGGKLYKVNQAHTSQDDWTPEATPALFSEVGLPDEILPWKQPQGAHDAYMKGDKVSHNEKHWISDIDNNIWEPGTVGTEALWREVN